MGKLLPSYKKAIYDEIIDNVSTNTSHYYAFAANPTPYTGSAPSVTNDDYATTFENDWKLLLGKKLSNTNILPVISKNIWVSNTVYDRYDNTSNTLYTNNNFYVICEPASVGGDCYVYKCIDNANGVISTTKPSSIGTPTQATTFTTSDNYKWRYVASISSQIYDNFSTTDFAPIYANSIIQSSALTNAGVEVVVISNGGIGYSSYTSGTVKSNPNTTIIEIDSAAPKINQFYTNNSIYLQNGNDSTSQIFGVAAYIANSTGNWVYLDSEANTTNITPAVTSYLITPKVVFDTDGDKPVAYSTINATSNSINSIVILYKGSKVSRANVSIQSNTTFGSGANLYGIVPPAGGHGADPATELNMKGIGIYFNFNNSESNTIVTANVNYNKIGLLKNPYALGANGTKGASRYTSNTFSQILDANLSSSYVFNIGETVTGLSSNAKGTVAFSNSTHVYLTGDKTFINGEGVANGAGVLVSNITINTLGSIYATDVKPLYAQNINNVNRSNTQNESFKLVIQI